jgi:hypothetical protein
MLDDDCDLLIDCLDPDCVGAPRATPCPRIRKDPTMILFGPPGGRDLFRSNGKLDTPAVDFTQLQVGWLLTNGRGAIYRAKLEAGDLVPLPNGKVFRFVDPDARYGAGKRGGIAVAKIKPLKDGSGYSYNVRAYGDLSAATDAAMAVQVYVGNQRPFMMSDIWTQMPRGWRAPKDH